jgi:hypothetical protein
MDRNSVRAGGGLAMTTLAAAHDSAARRAHPAPTRAQAEAGNYRMAHIVLHGLPITIENARGSTRRGIGGDGKPWESVLPAHYGYIKGTNGADGDHVDCYIGKHPASRRVFVVNQLDHETGKFDEHKVMLGYPIKKWAIRDYEKAFSDGKGKDRVGSVAEMSIEQFKDRLKQRGAFTKAIKRAAGGRAGFADGGAPEAFSYEDAAATSAAGTAKGFSYEDAAGSAAPRPHHLRSVKPLATFRPPRSQLERALYKAAPPTSRPLFIATAPSRARAFGLET